MSYQVRTIDHFEREAKRLKKKFRSLKDEIHQLINDLEENPFLGTSMRDGFYKIRLGIKSKRQKRWSKSYYVRQNNCRDSLSGFYL
ncbi:type II toxin-antitoxin system RelE/ParE family toxin [Spirosoma sp. KCTC 42546]|uniref:type II toxin-antitoxin system RelE family toxin n=1 Tax=Spirosoma sp. KCTC 42546 TaxID=2520506 RepID=UPI001FED6C81|nr:hypothetical protein [Spirosoma sp. KCTC 42546]